MEVVSQVMGHPVSHWLNAILAKLNPQLQQRRITPVKGVAYATHQVSSLLRWGWLPVVLGLWYGCALTLHQTLQPFSSD